MNRLHRSVQSLGTLAAALLLGSSSTLPVLAAMPQRQPTVLANHLSGEAVPLLASSDSDSDSDNKKKKKKQQEQQPKQKHQQLQSTPAIKQEHQKKLQKDTNQKLKSPTKNNNKSSDAKKKSDPQKHSTGDNKQRPSKSKVSDGQKQEIYQKGREDGLKKGREKGYAKGYSKGYEAGKKKGKDEAYHKAKRQEWQSWNRDQWRSYNRSRRNIWVRPVTYNRPFYGYPSWAQNPNWGYNRPWNNGWYSSANPSWSWWGGQALGWGINALTTALIVNNAINSAIRERQPTVAVPNSSMQLYYGSVDAMDETEVTFMVANGNDTYEMVADCEDGLLNGEVPTVVAEAELVNTACQVAFGSI